MTEHSPLGASSAERWMNCPGSVRLSEAFQQNPDLDEFEPEYRSLGTTAHLAITECLRNSLEPWELIGQTFGKHVVDAAMTKAIGVYIDECRRIMLDRPGGRLFIETKVSDPTIHEKFFGTVDFAYAVGNTVFVRDYKHGEGIEVECENNLQLMYYGLGLLRETPDTEWFDFAIVQPRGHFFGGAIKNWRCDAAKIREWAQRDLVPAMERAYKEDVFKAGDWCRFCPAKLACPLAKSLFRASIEYDPRDLATSLNETLDFSYPYIQTVEFYVKALKDEIYRRLSSGITFTNAKLVPKRADRIYKDGAETEFRRCFGKDAYTDPKLKSPAQMEQLNSRAKELVQEWAYMPQGGTTVAPSDDKRAAIRVQKASDRFDLAKLNYKDE